jgi:hypothetical protein
MAASSSALAGATLDDNQCKEDDKKILMIDVVGVDCGLGGRNCVRHMCCGHSIRVGDKLVCKWDIGVVAKKWRAKPPSNSLGDVEMEEQVKVFILNSDGLVGCQVGYLPRRLYKQRPAHTFSLTYLRVKQDYRLSYSKHERNRSTRFLGIVLCEVIYNNLNYNGHNPFEGDACNVSVCQSSMYYQEVERINKETSPPDDTNKVPTTIDINSTNDDDNRKNNGIPEKKKRKTRSDKGTKKENKKKPIDN